MSEHLKHKMYTHEVPPPAEVWRAIREELDAVPLSAAERLYNLEVPPPPQAWDHISAALGRPEVTSGTPVKRLYPAIYRWVAAAAITALIFSGVYYFTSSRSSNAGSIASAGTVLNTDQPKKTIPLSDEPRRFSSAKEKKTSSYRAYYIHNNPVKQDINNREEKALHSSLVEEPEAVPEIQQEVYVHARQILEASGEPIQDMSVVNPDNDKYISITAPNGQQTRVSSKLAIAMPYLGFLDAQQADAGNWKQLILQWREKILQSGFIPSSANFLDILEFTELIND